MLDLKILRTNIETIAAKLKTRGYSLNITKFKNLESRRHILQISAEDLRAKRNTKSKKIGKLKVKGEDISPYAREIEILTQNLKNAEKDLKQVKGNIVQFMAEIPNLPSADTPLGQDESYNVEVRRWKSPRKFNFSIKDHVALGKQFGGINFQESVKLTGSRFVIMKNKIALLHRVLSQFMLDTHVRKHGYEEVYVPYLVNKESLFGSGQLPKLSKDLFHIADDSQFSLIPTAEVSLTNLVRNEIILGERLPLKFVAHTPCFRREAGSYGRDILGMIRQHQFDKVELVQIISPENALTALEELTSHAEFILRALQLPYRVLQLCTSDIGFSACKTYDLEVWIPSQNSYREISSCSWCSDFQSRRMQARFKTADMKKSILLHTLNGSALAVGRTLVAILENYQQEDGSVIVPKVLQQYMEGLEFITS